MRILTIFAIVTAGFTGCTDDSPLQSSYGILVASQSSIRFEPTFVGARPEAAIELLNEGTFDVTYEVSVPDSSPYVIVSPSSGVVAPRSSTPLVLRFEPVEPGEHVTSISVASDAENGPLLEIPVIGVALAAIDCDDDNPCTDDVFDAANGTCAHSPREGICVSDNACLINTMCLDGVCLGEQRNCTPSVDCMEAYCEPQSGCVERPLPLTCDDDDPCTDDVCVSTTGCTHAESADFTVCGDPVQCVSVPLCQDGTCTPFPIPDGTSCNDGDFCTVAACSGGTCVGTYEPGEPAIAETRPFVLPRQSNRGAVELASGRGLFYSEAPYSWTLPNDNDVRPLVFSVVSFEGENFELLQRTPTQLDASAVRLGPLSAERAAVYSSFEFGPAFHIVSVDDAGNVAVTEQVTDYHPHLVIGAKSGVIFTCQTRFTLATVSIDSGTVSVLDSQESACNDAHWARDTELLVTLEGVYDASSGLPELVAERPASFDTYLRPFATHETVGFFSDEKAFIYNAATATYDEIVFAQPLTTASHGPDNPLLFMGDRVGRLHLDAGPPHVTDFGPLVLGVVGSNHGWQLSPEQGMGGFVFSEDTAVSPTGGTGYVGLGWTGSLSNVDDKIYSSSSRGLSKIELEGDERLRTVWGPRPHHFFSTLEIVRQGASFRAAQRFVRTWPATGPMTLDVYVYAHDDGILESLTLRELEGSLGSPTDTEQLSPAAFASPTRLYVVGFETQERNDMTLFVYGLDDLADGGDAPVAPLFSVGLEDWPYTPNAISVGVEFSGTGRAWVRISDFFDRNRLYLVQLDNGTDPPVVLAQGTLQSSLEEMAPGHFSVVLDDLYDDRPSLITYDGTPDLSVGIALNTPAGKPLLFNDETLLIGTETSIVFASNLGVGSPALSEVQLEEERSYPRTAVGVAGRLVVGANPALYTIYPPCPATP